MLRKRALIAIFVTQTEPFQTSCVQLSAQIAPEQLAIPLMANAKRLVVGQLLCVPGTGRRTFGLLPTLARMCKQDCEFALV
jgi:hypothetical protein